jgi:hypothetical protein
MMSEGVSSLFTTLTVCGWKSACRLVSSVRCLFRTLQPILAREHGRIMLGSTCAERSPRPWRRLAGLASPFIDRHQHLRRVIEHTVAPAFAVRRAALWAESRGSPAEAFARQVAMYLAHVSFGLTLSEVGRLFARDRSTVAHACALIEDRRDAAPFDRSLDLLEGALRLASLRQS